MNLLKNYSMLDNDVLAELEEAKENGLTPVVANAFTDKTLKVGRQEDKKGNVIYIVAEREVGNETRGMVYIPSTGEVYGTIYNNGKYAPYPIIDGHNDDGELVIACLTEAIIHSDKYSNKITSDMRSVTEEMYEGSKQLIKDGNINNLLGSNLKFIQDTIESVVDRGDIPLNLSANQPLELNPKRIKNGIYKPNVGDLNMSIFSAEKKSAKAVKNENGIGLSVEKWLNKFGNKFFADYEPNDEEKKLLEMQFEKVRNYLVTESAHEICLNYHKGGLKKGFLCGEAGTGKSTDCLIAATMLNLVYITQVYNYETTSADLLVRLMPKTTETTTLSMEEAEKIGGSILFDRNSAYQMITGKEATNNVSIGELLLAFLDRYSISDGSKYYTVDSTIVESARRPRFLEMQEVPKLRAPGILGLLNGLYDDQGGIKLSTGEYLKATPLSCAFITANGGNYEGNNDLPADFRSRFAWNPDADLLPAKEMVKRLFSDKTIIELIDKNEDVELKEAKSIANVMAKAVKKLQAIIDEDDAYNVSCSFREYKTWFQRYLVHPDEVIKMAKETVIAAITDDKEERDEYAKILESMFVD